MNSFLANALILCPLSGRNIDQKLVNELTATINVLKVNNTETRTSVIAAMVSFLSILNEL